MRSLCENCLTVSDQVRPFPIGSATGGQRDPIQDTLGLCPECTEPLQAHDLVTFNNRFRTERSIGRKQLEGQTE